MSVALAGDHGGSDNTLSSYVGLASLGRLG